MLALRLEEGEVFVVGGDEVSAGDEDRLEAVVLVGAPVIEVHVVEERSGALEEVVVERVLGLGLGEVGELLERGGVAVPEGVALEGGRVVEPVGVLTVEGAGDAAGGGRGGSGAVPCRTRRRRRGGGC